MRWLMTLLIPSAALAQLREKIVYTFKDPVVSIEIDANANPGVLVKMTDASSRLSLTGSYHPDEVRSWLGESADGRQSAESLFARRDVAAMDERIGDLSVALGITGPKTRLMRTSEKRRVELTLALTTDDDQSVLLILTRARTREVLNAFRRAATVADSMFNSTVKVRGLVDPLIGTEPVRSSLRSRLLEQVEIQYLPVDTTVSAQLTSLDETDFTVRYANERVVIPYARVERVAVHPDRSKPVRIVIKRP